MIYELNLIILQYQNDKYLSTTPYKRPDLKVKLLKYVFMLKLNTQPPPPPPKLMNFTWTLLFTQNKLVPLLRTLTTWTVFGPRLWGTGSGSRTVVGNVQTSWTGSLANHPQNEQRSGTTENETLCISKE